MMDILPLSPEEQTQRQGDVEQQKQDEDAARRRLGLFVGQRLGDLHSSHGRVLTHCAVARLDTYRVMLWANKGNRRVEWSTTAVLIERSLMGKQERRAA
jgi:hypothetical protein